MKRCCVLLMFAKHSDQYRPETRDAGKGATCRARTKQTRSLIRLMNARRSAEGRACHYILRNSIGALVLLCLTATGLAQVAISPQAGLIHYHVGQVTVEGQTIPSDPHRFVQLDPGQVLATKDGQAEVLLSPHSILRVGPDSRVRMLSNDSTDARVELIGGSALVDRRKGLTESVVSLVSGSAVVEIRDRGLYRLDALPGQPPVLRVFGGKATTHGDECEWRLKSRQAVRLDSSSLGVYAFDTVAADALDEWNRERAVRIAWLNRLPSGPNHQLVDGLKHIGRRLGKGRSNFRKGIDGGRHFPASARRHSRRQSRSASGSD